jgi:hypothetical protein
MSCPILHALLLSNVKPAVVAYSIIAVQLFKPHIMFPSSTYLDCPCCIVSVRSMLVAVTLTHLSTAVAPLELLFPCDMWLFCSSSPTMGFVSSAFV